MTNEPLYSRIARHIVSMFTPDGIDGFLLGMTVAFGGGIILYLWLTGQ